MYKRKAIRVCSKYKAGGNPRRPHTQFREESHRRVHKGDAYNAGVSTANTVAKRAG